MIYFSRNLLDPTPDDLRAALADAAQYGDADGSSARWKAAILRRYDSEPEGQAEHRWPRRGRERRKGHLVWWRDALGRRHVRVVGLVAEGVERLEYDDGHDAAPPLLRIYPDAGFLVDDAAILVICPCGAAGRPDEIGWVGGECGPCHDRRVNGELPARPWDVATRDFTTGDCLAWLDEARLLLREDHVLYVRDVASGRTLPLKEQFGLALVGWSRDGRLVALLNHERYGHGLHVVRTDTLGVVRAIPDELPDISCIAFSPSGRYLVVADDFQVDSVRVYPLYRADAAPLRLPGGYWTFSADEATLYLADGTRPFRLRVCPLDPPGPPRAVPLPGIADPLWLHKVCPDGVTVVLRTVNMILAVDTCTGEILGSRRTSGPGPAILACDGRVFVAGAVNNREIHVFTVPDLSSSRRLAVLEGPQTSTLLDNGHWLAVSDGDRTRLVPWPPLRDWFLRQED